ncbi:MAG: hypothetical protein MJB14_23585 [Spirochaetes bacterium]|nr:hypothetical protein [Spirochaetota bacterium]
MNNFALIFPAFREKLLEKDLIFSQENSGYFKDKIKILNQKFPSLQWDAHHYDEICKDELNSQIYSYTYSCAMADFLDFYKIRPNYISGYSMGIYAALYYNQVYSFEAGLDILVQAYSIVRNTIPLKYSVGVIIGLDQKDIKDITTPFEYELINQNNPYSYVITGLKKDIQKIIDLAKQEGGINSQLLNITLPYHTSFLGKSDEKLKDFIEEIVFHTGQFPYVSAVNQKVIKNSYEFKSEIIINLKSHLNWYKTMQLMINKGMKYFVECGIGNSLQKISRLIEGKFKTISWTKMIS